MLDRNSAIEKFENSSLQILVGTDVIGRGIDFNNVNLIINYDVPSNLDCYIHRIGRTGRCGASGHSISFINENNKNSVRDIFEYLKFNNFNIPETISNLCYKLYGYKQNKSSESSKYSFTYIKSISFKEINNSNEFYKPLPVTKMSWRKL